MFVRKKKNRSGTTSVVVADKSEGRFRELKTIGVSSDEKTISDLCQAGKKWISERKGDLDMFALHEQQREEKHVTDCLLGNILICARTHTVFRLCRAAAATRMAVSTLLVPLPATAAYGGMPRSTVVTVLGTGV